MKINWWVKAGVSRYLSGLPGGEYIYYFLQKKFGSLRNYSIVNKVSQGLKLLQAMQEINYSVLDKRTVEIGTGWSPVIPLLFYIFGQTSCETYDTQKLLKPELTLNAARQLSELKQYLIKNAQNLWNHTSKDRLFGLQSVTNDLSQLLDKVNLYYHAPADASKTMLDAHSIDVFFSNTTLEHIPAFKIEDLFQEAKRILSQGGIMVHLIDCNDHYSFQDKSISRINFLSFSRDEWKKYNTKFIYQNRLRASSYRELAEKAGFKIELWLPRIDPQIKANLHNFPLDKEFINISPDDISTTSVVMVASI